MGRLLPVAIVPISMSARNHLKEHHVGGYEGSVVVHKRLPLYVDNDESYGIADGLICPQASSRRKARTRDTLQHKKDFHVLCSRRLIDSEAAYVCADKWVAIHSVALGSHEDNSAGVGERQRALKGWAGESKEFFHVVVFPVVMIVVAISGGRDADHEHDESHQHDLQRPLAFRSSQHGVFLPMEPFSLS